MTWIRKKEEFTNPLPTGMFPILLPLNFEPDEYILSTEKQEITLQKPGCFHKNLGRGAPIPPWLAPTPTWRIVVIFGWAPKNPTKACAIKHSYHLPVDVIVEGHCECQRVWAAVSTIAKYFCLWGVRAVFWTCFSDPEMLEPSDPVYRTPLPFPRLI